MISQGKKPCTEIEVGAKTDIFNLQFKDSQLSVFCVTQVCRACHHSRGGHPITPTEGGEDGGGGCGRGRFEGVQSRPHPTASHRPQQARPLCLSESPARMRQNSAPPAESPPMARAGTPRARGQSVSWGSCSVFPDLCPAWPEPGGSTSSDVSHLQHRFLYPW